MSMRRTFVDSCLRSSVIAVVICSMLSVAATVQVVADEPKAKPSDAKEMFEQIKSLAGDWEGNASHGDDSFPATVSYRVTSAGSSVIETLFAGQDHEMITMYHLHGDKLMLTHYCAAGNQPRLVGASSAASKKISFSFLDGTNMDAAKDMHMHEAVFEFVDANHMKTLWTSYDNGKPLSTSTFDMKRKQPAAKSN